MLHVHEVMFGYGSRQILFGINLELDQGVTCLLGPNGAGKSSLLRILATIARPRSGSVQMVHGGKADPIRREQLGYVPQGFTHYPHFTVRNLIEYVAGMKRVPSNQIGLAVERVIEETDLGDYAEQRLGTLSGGTLQRAAIAQALVNNPALLILDEPTSGLDPAQRRSFLELVGRVASDRIVILSTHLVEDVAAVANKIVILDRGRIAFNGVPPALGEDREGFRVTVEDLAIGYERILVRGKALSA